MTRLLWLPDVLRAAGLTVHEVSGWRERGTSTFDPRGIICHATAGSSTSTDAGEIRVLLQGSTSAPPPIAQLYLSRTGAFHVVASGRCNHALQGWGGPLKGYGNTHLIGIEAQNDNRGQPWPAAQLDAYQRGVAAICRRMGWTPARNVAAHREHQPGAKSDPHGIDMASFRTRVGALLTGGLEDDMFSTATFLEALQNPAVQREMRRLAVSYTGGGLPDGMSFLGAVNETLLTVRAIADRVDIDPAELQQIRTAAREGAASAADALVAAVVAQLPDDAAGMDREQVVAAVKEGVRDVLGSLNDPAPAATQ